jgi:hypothetical protein
MRVRSLVAGFVMLLGACGAKQAAIDEVQYGVTSASAVGRVAALAMDGIKGMSSSCVAVTTACASYPCNNGAVTITLGPGCLLPLGGAATGSVTVTGSWSSADQAMLQQVYANAQVTSAGKALAIASVTQISASRSGNTINIQYSGTSAVAGASGSAVAVGGGDTWTVAINTQGTADPSDDVLTVNATSASGGGLSGARVASISGAVLSASCQQNPTAGSAQITQVAGGLVPVPTITNISFHSTCDGKAEVDGSTVQLQLLP